MYNLQGRIPNFPKTSSTPGKKWDVSLFKGLSKFCFLRALMILTSHIRSISTKTTLITSHYTSYMNYPKYFFWSTALAATSRLGCLKDGRIRVITDFRELNKAIVRHPWPMPHISDMLENIGKYTYATCLDLSMGYYHLRTTSSQMENVHWRIHANNQMGPRS
jgi:hypothetical protein